VENKPASSLVMESRASNQKASNRKVAKPWLDSRCGIARRVSLRKTPNAILGPSNLPVVVAYAAWQKTANRIVLCWSGMIELGTVNSLQN